MELALSAAIVLLLGATAFAQGGVSLAAGPLFSAGAAFLALVQAVRAARRPRPLDRALLLVAGLAAAPLLVGALELVPISRATVRALAPATAEIYDREDRAAGASEARARPLSLEPGTSRRALLRGAALVSLFLLAAGLSSRERN
ncbi:hypothetical protein HY251_06555, partial [bacterium]|nr:hypothetical protein [bacterium]